MGITATFTHPFYEGGGSAITTDVPAVWPVAIGGHGYIIDLDQYERQSLDILRTQADSSSEPGEHSLNPTGLWRRSQESWHLGAGQTYLDLADASRQRFRSSKGIDVWTKGRLSLLPSSALRKTSVNANLRFAAVSGFLYVTDGNTLYATADPSVASPTWTAITGTPGSSALSITTDGYSIWVAYNTDIYSLKRGDAAATVFSAQNAQMVGYANGRLLCADGAALYELSSAGAATLLWTHPNADWVWDSVVAAPQCIYVTGHSGDRGELYRINFVAATTALGAPTPATNLPDGERVLTVAPYIGLVMLATSAGVRIGSADADGNISYGPLIPTPTRVQCLEPQDSFVWFGWSNYDTASTGLGRVDLSVLPNPSVLKPAYASDLMTAGQGTVTDVCTYGDKRYFSVAGLGVYGQSTDLVATGTIDSGLLRWGTTERKTVHSIDVRTEALIGSLTVSVAVDGGTFESVATSAVAGATGSSVPYSTRLVTGEQAEVRVQLSRGTDPTTGPALIRYTVLALATPVRSEQILVPVILKSRIDLGETFRNIDVNAEFAYLKSLERSGLPVSYQEGVLSYTVTVSRVSRKPESWGERQSWLNGTVFVLLQTIEG